MAKPRHNQLTLILAVITFTLRSVFSNLLITHFSEQPFCDGQTFLSQGCFYQVASRTSIQCFLRCLQDQSCLGVLKVTSSLGCYLGIGCPLTPCSVFDTKYRYYVVNEEVQDQQHVTETTSSSSLKTSLLSICSDSDITACQDLYYEPADPQKSACDLADEWQNCLFDLASQCIAATPIELLSVLC